jgi:hypothetical protein
MTDEAMGQPSREKRLDDVIADYLRALPQWKRELEKTEKGPSDERPRGDPH